jgi:hypothetical protein
MATLLLVSTPCIAAKITTLPASFSTTVASKHTKANYKLFKRIWIDHRSVLNFFERWNQINSKEKDEIDTSESNVQLRGETLLTFISQTPCHRLQIRKCVKSGRCWGSAMI